MRAPLRAALLAVLLAARVSAQVQSAAAPSVAVYPAPAAGWTQTLSAPSLSAVGLDPAHSAGLAPLTYELSHTLGLTPASFSALSASEQESAVHMAHEQARADLSQKVYELVGESKKLVWAKSGVNKEQLDKLYPLAAKLREIDREYGAFLSEDEREIVSQSAAQSAAAWRDARAAYVGAFGEATRAALEAGTRKTEQAAAEGRAAQPPPLVVGSSARKLRERMEGTQVGWSQSDFEVLYSGYGFAYREGGNHRVYYHPFFKQLTTSVGRHGELKPHYARTALKLIAELEALSTPAGLPSAAAKDDELPPPLDYAAAAKTPPAANDDGYASSTKRRERRPAPVSVAAAQPLNPPAAVSASQGDHSRPQPTSADVAERLKTARFEPVSEKTLAETKPPRVPWWRRWLNKLGGS